MFLLHASFPRMGNVELTTICLLIVAVPLWLRDFIKERVYKRPSTGLLTQPGKINKERLVIKLIGLHGTLLIILFLYYLNPTYRISPRTAVFYNSFFYFLNLLAPWIVILSFVYFWIVDRRQKDPYDEYWHMGCLLTGRWKEVNPVVLKEHAKVWFIKAFFTPFMFAILVTSVGILLAYNWKGGFLSLFDYSLTLFYAIDVIYGVLGYILTFRLLDTHIRSTDPTLLGWVVCLACYSPFANFGINLFNYDDGINWNHWFAFPPGFYYFYGITIIFLSLVYCLATVAFGYRMSNLTFRGIITSGPYRFTKHPAYLCKVASWWLISLPFLSVEGPWTALKYTFSLSMITFIYYLRARTEEYHLSKYPEYVAYANWIKEHGMFSSIRRHFPALNKITLRRT